MKPHLIPLLLLLACSFVAAEAHAEDQAEAQAETEAEVDANDPGDLDVVVLTNEHRIHGYVLGDMNGDQVTIRTSGGLIRISQQMIAEIEEALERRRERLVDGDYQGHLELARWALSRDERQVALELMIAVSQHPDLDLAGLAILARLTDEMEGWEAALPWYRQYRQMGGKDAGLLQRLAQLEKADSKHQQDLAQHEAVLANRVINEGLESTRRWRVEDPRWANAARADTVEIPGSGGDKVLRMRFNGGDRNKKAIIGWRESLDVRQWRTLHFDVNNASNGDFGMSIAVKVGNNWEYFESKVLNVPSDSQWHSVDVDLRGREFKCAKDDWASYSHEVSDPRDIREVQLQVHNGQRDGVVFINNLGFKKKTP